MGRIATYAVVQVLKKNPELGKRLLHDLLTRHNSTFTDGVWSETTNQYESGKLNYDDFSKFYIIRHIS